MLEWVYEAEASSGWHTSPGYFELRQALGGNKGNMSVSLRNLEAKGLITVYRTRGGQASSLWLTKEGKNRVENLARFKFQLTVCDPKLGVPLDVAKRTVHYFWGLMKQAEFS
jgi:DNA-binding MarR family transcriptional regulator